MKPFHELEYELTFNMTSTRAVAKYKLPPDVLSGYSGHRHRRLSEEGVERAYQSGAFAELAVGTKQNTLEDFTYSEYSIAKGLFL